MDVNSQYELYLIKSELNKIIEELYIIAGGVSRDFEGIGNDRCADCLLKVASHYENVKQKLNSMDMSTLSDEFAAKQHAEAEAKAREKAQAKAKSDAKARAESEAKKRAEAKTKTKSKNSDNILEDVFGWLFK